MTLIWEKFQKARKEFEHTISNPILQEHLQKNPSLKVELELRYINGRLKDLAQGRIKFEYSLTHYGLSIALLYNLSYIPTSQIKGIKDILKRNGYRLVEERSIVGGLLLEFYKEQLNSELHLWLCKGSEGYSLYTYVFDKHADEMAEKIASFLDEKL
jgi:CRISPR/Cas system CMR subunit Cmr6 (Cas7 group RAMP superfamily)